MRVLASRPGHLQRFIRHPPKDPRYLSKGLVRVTAITVTWQSEYSWLSEFPPQVSLANWVSSAAEHISLRGCPLQYRHDLKGWCVLGKLGQLLRLCAAASGRLDFSTWAQLQD